MIVLHYIPTLSPADGGTATYMQQLADHLGQRVELHIVAHPTAQRLEVRHASLHFLTNSWRLWQVRREYLQILAQVHPDVVHVNCCWRPVFAYAAIWAKEAGYRVVLSPHGMLEPWILRRHYWSRKVPSLLLWQRRALMCADRIHACSSLERQHILDIGGRCRLLRQWHPEVCVIANGIRVGEILMRTSWQRTHRILFMSRLHPKKGLELLLSAFCDFMDGQQKVLSAELSSVGQALSYELWIAGEGDAQYKRELQQLARDGKYGTRIKFLGGVYGESKWQLLQEADLVVLPSYSENYGLIVAEALASGTPVLTTDQTPWQELNTRHCGWCIPAESAALIQALTDFALLDEASLEAMGRAGRALVEEQCDAARISELFLFLYQKVCCS